jgi:SAM-dependent methyltransferase
MDTTDIAQAQEKIRSFVHYQLLIREYAPQNIRRIVDIGCGTRDFWHLWYEDGAEVYAVDFTPSPAHTIQSLDDTTVVYARERKMWPFANNFFDAATLIDIPGIYRDPAPLIVQSLRLLRKNGVLLIAVSEDYSLSLPDPELNLEKYRNPQYWCGLVGGLGFHRVLMKLYFTCTLPPFEMVRKVFRRLNLPVVEHLIPISSASLARKYIFICQK